MLAKIWKKVLLAICILACIFNIMSKLVNRHSLKENLESANDGETVFSIFQKEEVVSGESEEIIDGVVNPAPEQNVVEENTVVENESVVVENTTENAGTTENLVEENTTEPTEEVTEETPEEDRTFKFSDFVIMF